MRDAPAAAAGADTDADTGAESTPPADWDLTIAAVGTSVTWGTGNRYELKYPNLVHRDLNGGYPLSEKYLHYNPGRNEEPNPPRYPYVESPGTDSDSPTPSYYERTLDDGYDLSGSATQHPRGPHIPPSRYRARGGAIIGLDWPATVEFGDTKPNAPCGPGKGQLMYNDSGGYLASGPPGEYDGKLDGLGQYASLGPEFADLFDTSTINHSKWLLMRDIGWGWPTIPDQIAQFENGGSGWREPADVPEAASPSPFGYTLPKSPPAGEDVDLVIVDGGTNDMQLGWLNDPLKAGREKIRKAAELYFYDNMTGSDGLLRRARETFPNAVIVLVGEPVWTSNLTDYGRAREFLIANNWLGAVAVEQAIDNPLNFSHFQAHFLRKALSEEARRDDGPGMVFAPPGYGIVNAMMAEWPWSFGVVVKPGGGVIRDEGDYEVGGLVDEAISVDDTVVARERVCAAETEWEERRTSGDCADEIASKVACPAAGVGHPNNEGSRQYADTIVRRYKEHIDLPVGKNADELHDGTGSLRRSLERYGLGPDGDGLRGGLSGSDVGTRWALSHRVVDSIRVETTTAQPQGAAQPALTTGRPYLGVRPGRRGEAGAGDRERFVLDTESRDYVGTDGFYVDPMMRRRLTGPVGNVDVSETGVKTGTTETTNQTIHPTGHWSDRRLRLGMVDHLTLVLRNSGGWDLERVRYELNGSIEGTRTLGGRFDYADFETTVRPREFQLASFNAVDGASASDLAFTTIVSGFDGTLGSPAEATVSYGVENTSGVDVPDVLLQYGWRVDGEGRDWQVADIGDVPAGESRSVEVTLTARQDPAFRTGTITVHAGVFVGDTANWTSFETSRGDLDDL